MTNPQRFNLYAYATNDPINHTDPLGLEGVSPIKLLKVCAKAAGMIFPGAAVACNIFDLALGLMDAGVTLGAAEATAVGLAVVGSVAGQAYVLTQEPEIKRSITTVIRNTAGANFMTGAGTWGATQMAYVEDYEYDGSVIVTETTSTSNGDGTASTESISVQFGPISGGAASGGLERTPGDREEEE